MTEVRACPGHGCTRPLADAEFLCRACQHRAELILGDLPALTREVEITTARQDRIARGGRTVQQQRELAETVEDVRNPPLAGPQPLVVNLSASERARREFGLLFEWSDHVAAWYRLRGLPINSLDKPLTTLVPAAVAILLRNSDWMRTAEQGPDLASAIWYVRQRVRRIVDSRDERLYAGPCKADLGYGPELGYGCRASLYRRWGADDIVCDGHEPDPRKPIGRGCGTVHAAAARHEFLIAAVEDHLLPLKLVWESLHVLIPGCDVPWKTAEQWTRAQRQRVTEPTKTGGTRARIRVTPPRLPETGLDHLGRPLYRGGDILDLARDTERRRGRRRVTRVNVA